jgi:hypothetical protein
MGRESLTTVNNMLFERTYIIALPQRRDRAARLKERFPDAVVVNAFQGRDLAAPKWFKAGFGAWGCYMSHLHVLMAATHDKLDNYVVFEEDVLLKDDFEEQVVKLLQEVPANWGQIYLGGCHQAAPEMLNEFIYACHSVDRTHAFAVSHRAFKPMLTHLLEVERFFVADKPKHVDQVLQQAHEKCLWPVYAPTWWLAGQCGGMSSISLDKQPDRWWHCPAYARALPFVLCGERPTDNLLECLHFGKNANEDLEDWRLLQGVGEPAKLVPFLIHLATEALIYGKLPALRTDKLSQEYLKMLGFAVLTLGDDIAGLANYPHNNLINNGYYPKRK